MVSKIVTSVPRMNPPKLERVGPVMHRVGLHKYVTVPQISDPATKIKDSGLASLTLEYSSGVNTHRAGIVRSDPAGETGALICSYCTLTLAVAWCPHLHYVTSRGLDQSLYDPPSDADVVEWRVLVPIIPSEGVFAPVSFRRHAPQRQFVIAEAVLSDPEASTPPPPIELGVLLDGAFGTLEVRAMFIDMFVGRRHDRSRFGEVGESRVPTTTIDDEFTDAATTINKKISDFSHQYYQAVWRKTLGELELTGQTASDAPIF